MRQGHQSTGMEQKGYYANKLLNKIYISNQTLVHPIDLTLIQKAIHHLQIHHNTAQEGTNKQPYTQTVAVALMLTEYYPTTEALVSALLYDMAQKNILTHEQIASEFSSTIDSKVANLVNLYTSQHAANINEIKKIIEGGDKDMLMVSLLDNLYTMQTISTKPKWEQLEIALQTLKTFLPLAIYMGFPAIENELEEICKDIIIPELSKDKSSSLISSIDLRLLEFPL